MKKTLLLAGVAITFAASTANAAYIEVNPYVGIDFSTMEATYGRGADKLIEDDYSAFSVSGGVRIEKYLGFEAYVQRSNRESYKHPTSKWTTNHWSYGVDALAFLPLYNDLELLGGIGFGEYKIWAREAGHKTHKDTGYGTRFTVGAQYNFDYNWSIRATYRYVDYKKSFMNHSGEWSAGIRYTF